MTKLSKGMAISNKPITLGEYLRDLRVKNNLSLKGLAKALNVDFSLISKIEHGERTLSPELIPALARIFELDYKTLRIELRSVMVAEEFGQEEYGEEVLKAALKKIS